MTRGRSVIRAQRTWIGGSFRPAAIVVERGLVAGIVDVRAHVAGARTVLVPDDAVLLPGLVDSHVHVNEPGRTEWEGFRSATLAAAAGGVTTIVDMPLNSLPPTTTPDALEVKRAAAVPSAFIDIGFWGGAVPENLGALAPLHDAGVFGFKCFLSPSGVDEFGHLDRAQLLAAMTEIAAIGLAADRARRGPGAAARPWPARPRLRRVPGVAARRERGIRHRRRDRRRPPHRRAGAHPASERRPLTARDPGREGRRGRAHGRDVPALPDDRGRGDPRGRERVQVLPADPRGREPRPALGGRRRRDDRRDRERPLALDRRPEALRRRRLRPGVGRDLGTPGRSRGGVDRGAGPRHPAGDDPAALHDRSRPGRRSGRRRGHRGRRARAPDGLRRRRPLRDRRRAAAAQEPDHRVRPPGAHRPHPPHLAARRAGVRRHGGRARRGAAVPRCAARPAADGGCRQTAAAATAGRATRRERTGSADGPDGAAGAAARHRADPGRPLPARLAGHRAVGPAALRDGCRGADDRAGRHGDVRHREPRGDPRRPGQGPAGVLRGARRGGGIRPRRCDRDRRDPVARSRGGRTARRHGTGLRRGRPARRPAEDHGGAARSPRAVRRDLEPPRQGRTRGRAAPRRGERERLHPGRGARVGAGGRPAGDRGRAARRRVPARPVPRHDGRRGGGRRAAALGSAGRARRQHRHQPAHRGRGAVPPGAGARGARVRRRPALRAGRRRGGAHGARGVAARDAALRGGAARRPRSPSSAR